MSIIVSAKELYEKVSEIHGDKMDFVEITLDNGDNSDPDDPPYISFSAWTKDASFEHIDYEDIEGITSEF